MLTVIFALLGILCVLLAILDLRSEHSTGATIFFLCLYPLILVMGLMDIDIFDVPEVSRTTTPILFYSFIVGEVGLATVFILLSYNSSGLYSSWM